MIVQVFVAAAQRIQPLRNQVAHLMDDHVLITGIMQRGRHGTRQSNAPVDLSQQHQTAVGTERTALEIGVNFPAPEAPKRHLISGTLWHRRNLVNIGLDTCINAPHGCSADLPYEIFGLDPPVLPHHLDHGFVLILGAAGNHQSGCGRSVSLV